jgi:hypothetical protein
MKEDESFLVLYIYKKSHQQKKEKEEERFLVKYLWMKGWGSRKSRRINHHTQPRC